MIKSTPFSLFFLFFLSQVVFAGEITTSVEEKNGYQITKKFMDGYLWSETYMKNGSQEYSVAYRQDGTISYENDQRVSPQELRNYNEKGELAHITQEALGNPVGEIFYKDSDEGRISVRYPFQFTLYGRVISGEVEVKNENGEVLYSALYKDNEFQNDIKGDDSFKKYIVLEEAKTIDSLEKTLKSKRELKEQLRKLKSGEAEHRKSETKRESYVKDGLKYYQEFSLLNDEYVLSKESIKDLASDRLVRVIHFGPSGKKKQVFDYSDSAAKKISYDDQGNALETEEIKSFNHTMEFHNNEDGYTYLFDISFIKVEGFPKKHGVVEVTRKHDGQLTHKVLFLMNKYVEVLEGDEASLFMPIEIKGYEVNPEKVDRGLDELVGAGMFDVFKKDKLEEIVKG